MATYTPPAPWTGATPTNPIAVVDNFGNEWEAYGPNQLKKPTVVLEQPEDCCLYSFEVTDSIEDFDPSFFNPPGKSQGDTLFVCTSDGFAMYECDGTAWGPLWDKTLTNSTGITAGNHSASDVYDPDNPPTAPVATPNGVQTGDIRLECLDGALCVWRKTNAGWARIFCKEIKDCAANARNPEDPNDYDCHYNDPGVITGQQVDEWLDLNLEFDDAPLTGITNPCRSTVQGSGNSDAGVFAGVYTASGSQALGGVSVVTASVAGRIAAGVVNGFVAGSFNSDIFAGERNVMEAAFACAINDGKMNVMSGRNNVHDLGDWNHMSGFGNQIVDGSSNLVAGNRNTLIPDAANPTPNQDRNLVVGNQHTLTGGECLIGGFDNVIRGNRNIVNGGMQIIDGNSFDNMVSGSTNTLLNPNGTAQNDNCAQNLVGGIFNLLEGTVGVQDEGVRNNVTVGAQNIQRSWNTVMCGFLNEIDQSSVDSVIFGRQNYVGDWSGSVLAARHTLTGGAQNRNGFRGSVVFGQVTENVAAFQHTMGFGAAGSGAVTANRTHEHDMPSGNYDLAGAVAAGTVFPGFGEYAVVERELEDGLFVKFDGLDGAVIADGDDFDGISRKELSISAGGGNPIENSRWLLDDFGNRIFADQEFTEEVVSGYEFMEVDAGFDITNEEGEVIGRHENIQVLADKSKPIVKEVTSTIYGPLPNPKYNPALEVTKVGVEMMGRVWLQVDGEVAVGNYLTAGKGGKGVVSKEKTSVRVLSVAKGKAFVVIK